MLKYILPLGAVLAIIPLQAQTVPTHNNQNQNLQPSASQQATANDSNTARNNSRIKVSNDISTVLNDTNEARRAIARNDKTQALSDVNDALFSLQQAKTAAPNEKLVPLYTETDSYSVMGPIWASRNNQVNQPGQVRPSGQYNANQTGTANKNGQGPEVAVQKAYGQFTSVMLDTQLADTHLRAAKAELERGNLTKADEGLKATQDAVIVTSAEADLPLLRARENLMLARGSANSGDYQEAMVALQSADRALNNYANSNSRHAAEAKTLAAQIGYYDKTMSQNPSDLTTKINNWWGQTMDWIGSGSSNQTASNNTTQHAANNATQQ